MVENIENYNIGNYNIEIQIEKNLGTQNTELIKR